MSLEQENEKIRRENLKIKSFELAKGLKVYKKAVPSEQTVTDLIRSAEKIYQELIKTE